MSAEMLTPAASVAHRVATTPEQARDRLVDGILGDYDRGLALARRATGATGQGREYARQTARVAARLAAAGER